MLLRLRLGKVLISISSKMMETVASFRNKPHTAHIRVDFNDDNLSPFRKVVSQPMIIFTTIFAVVELVVRIAFIFLLTLTVPFSRQPIRKMALSFRSTVITLAWSFQSILSNPNFGKIEATELQFLGRE